MLDTSKGMSAFHNIYKTGTDGETSGGVLHEGDSSGEGTMQRFEVAPGIQITYNDLKMDSCFRPIFNRHSIHSGQPFEKHFSFHHIHPAANSIVLSGISYS